MSVTFYASYFGLMHWELALTPFDSRQAIQKYIKANNKVDNLSDIAFKGHVNRAITHGEEKGVFLRPKGKCCTLSFQYPIITASTAFGSTRWYSENVSSSKN